jgi:hypothetical protein
LTPAPQTSKTGTVGNLVVTSGDRFEGDDGIQKGDDGDPPGNSILSCSCSLPFFPGFDSRQEEKGRKVEEPEQGKELRLVENHHGVNLL